MDSSECEARGAARLVPSARPRPSSCPESSEACECCGLASSEDDNDLLFCDGCDKAFHQLCSHVPTIPDGEWRCRACLEENALAEPEDMALSLELDCADAETVEAAHEAASELETLLRRTRLCDSADFGFLALFCDVFCQPAVALADLASALAARLGGDVGKEPNLIAAFCEQLLPAKEQKSAYNPPLAHWCVRLAIYVDKFDGVEAFNTFVDEDALPPRVKTTPPRLSTSQWLIDERDLATLRWGYAEPTEDERESRERPFSAEKQAELEADARQRLCALSPPRRARLLRLLCDAALCDDDYDGYDDDARGSRARPRVRELECAQRSLGVDEEGRAYHLLEDATGAAIVCRSSKKGYCFRSRVVPASASRGKGFFQSEPEAKSLKALKAASPQADVWETVAATPDAILALANKLAASRHRDELWLARVLHAELGPHVAKRVASAAREAKQRDRARRRTKAAQKLLGDVLVTNGPRKRTQPDYTHAQYDDDLDAALDKRSTRTRTARPR